MSCRMFANTKRMSLELQLLDSNCNECIFMVRDTVAYKNKLQEVRDETERRFYVELYRLWDCNTKENDIEMSRMKLQLPSKINEGFGHCSKLNKPVTFIPETCQVHTQECFQHRKYTAIDYAILRAKERLHAFVDSYKIKYTHP